jgi:hypothetical protein
MGDPQCKIGATYEHTFLTEHDGFAIVNPGLRPTCPSALAAQCAALQPYDLTTGGALYHYRGHTDVKETALYAEDSIMKGPWAISFGVRGDFYINDNLVLPGTGCNDSVVNAVMTVAQGFNCQSTPLVPGFRNEFHAASSWPLGDTLCSAASTSRGSACLETVSSDNLAHRIRDAAEGLRALEQFLSIQFRPYRLNLKHFSDHARVNLPFMLGCLPIWHFTITMWTWHSQTNPYLHPLLRVP